MDALTFTAILIWVALALLFAGAAYVDSQKVREAIVGVR